MASGYLTMIGNAGMSSFAAAALVIGLLVLFGVPALWWVLRDGKGPSPARNRAAEERFRQRQRNPDWEAFRQHFDRDPSPVLKTLYSTTELFSDDRDHFKLELADKAGRKKRWYIAWIEPLDKEHLDGPTWPGTEGFYSFANNGSGDQYLIDPQSQDPEVIYYNHESRKMKPVGASLSQFLSAQRNYDSGE